MSVKLTEQVPAFRIDDDVLERLWRGIEAKWAGEEPAMNTLTVHETVRVAGRRTTEEHEQDYQSVDESACPTGRAQRNSRDCAKPMGGRSTDNMAAIS